MVWAECTRNGTFPLSRLVVPTSYNFPDPYRRHHNQRTHFFGAIFDHFWMSFSLTITPVTFREEPHRNPGTSVTTRQVKTE